MATQVDKRLYSATSKDHFMVLQDGHPIVTPFLYARVLGPLNPNIEDLSPTKLNGATEDTSAIFVETEKDQLKRLLGIGPVDANREINFSSTVGMCSFELFTPERTVDTVTPYKLESDMRAIPLAAINARTFDSFLDLDIFVPEQVGVDGIQRFKYVGEGPLNTVLSGTINFFARVETETSYVRRVLSLEPVSNVPPAIIGNNNGKVYLASNHRNMIKPAVYWKWPSQYLIYNLATPSASMIETMMAPEVEDLFPGYEVGHFSIYTTTDSSKYDPELLYPDASNTDEQNANLKSTRWFDVTGGDYLYLQPMQGVSTRCRIQYRTRWSNTIHFKDYARSSNGYIQVPRDAVTMRIYYCGANDTVKELAIRNRTKFGNLESVDPYIGWWQEYTFHVNAAVTFWPGTVYYFGIYSTVERIDRYISTDSAYIVSGGGLNCLFNAKPQLTKLAEQLGIFDVDTKENEDGDH